MLQYALADQSSSVQRWVDTAADEITAVNHQQHRRIGVAAVGQMMTCASGTAAIKFRAVRMVKFLRFFSGSQ
mgnify:FL=1